MLHYSRMLDISFKKYNSYFDHFINQIRLCNVTLHQRVMDISLKKYDSYFDYLVNQIRFCNVTSLIRMTGIRLNKYDSYFDYFLNQIKFYNVTSFRIYDLYHISLPPSILMEKTFNILLLDFFLYRLFLIIRYVLKS